MEFRLKEVESIISKIVRDLGIGDKEIPYQDYIEWIYEGLQMIGAYSQYKEKIGKIKIEGYQGKLPSDYFSMMANPGLKYKLSHDTIYVEAKEGEVSINYLALPVDERGYPLIPDNISYDEALKWKVAYMLAIRGDLPKHLTLEFTQAQWFKYVRQARAVANAFTPDQVERLRDTRMKLVPDMHQYDVGFHRVDGRFKQDNSDGRN
jgi:hypothetical protein